MRKIIDVYSRALKRHTVGIRFGEIWQNQDAKKWFDESKLQMPLVTEDIINFIKKQTCSTSFLDIGCGPGIYPILYKELFLNRHYTGIDISKSFINFCKNNSDFEFICDDFLKRDFISKFDCIFSRSVIDHVNDVDLFLKKIVTNCTKSAYIYAYRGFYPELLEHKSVLDRNGGYFMNNLSPKKLSDSLIEAGLSENEFVVRPKNSGFDKWKVGCVIEIEKF